VTVPVRPAAFIPRAETGAAALTGRPGMAEAARLRGWPAPTIYAEDDEPHGPAGEGLTLRRLEAAITAGRHDALLLTAPGTLGDPGPLMRLLSRCTTHGVQVSFVPLPGGGHLGRRPAPAASGRSAAQAAPAAPAGRAEPQPVPQVAPTLVPTEPWSVLTRARLEALADIYPDWRIWLDDHGWHARRRAEYLQDYQSGAPTFCVHAQTAVDLAAQICWQQAADAYVPGGCPSGHPTPPPHAVSFLHVRTRR
jgi:hypothetical protein